jgi:putative ABC transport system substrate-binding protein
MSRKMIIVVWLISLVLAPFRLAEAQQPAKVPRIGYLDTSGNHSTPSPRLEASRRGLRELGYVEGKSILLEYRYAEGNLDRMPSLVAELVQLKPAAIVVSAVAAIRAAKEMTRTIPIVIIATVEPIAMGIVDSLARPGGNIRGLALLTRDLSAKRLELLTEVIQKNRGWQSSGARPSLGLRLLLKSRRLRHAP